MEALREVAEIHYNISAMNRENKMDMTLFLIAIIAFIGLIVFFSTITVLTADHAIGAWFVIMLITAAVFVKIDLSKK